MSISGSQRVEVVPAVRRARKRNSIGDHALGEQFHGRLGRFCHGAGAVQTAVIARPRPGKAFDAFAQPKPGIFLELTDVLLDHDRDEKFHRLETDAVHLRRGRRFSCRAPRGSAARRGEWCR